MPCFSDPSISGYIISLWCVAKSQFFETYTPLTICIFAISIAWIFLWKRRRQRKKTHILPPSLSSLRDATFLVLGGVLLYAMVGAPYKLYVDLAKDNESLGRIKNDVMANEKKEILVKLFDLLKEGRDLESERETMFPGHPLMEQKLLAWNIHNEQVELTLKGSRYRSYAALLKDESSFPQSYANDSERSKAWKSLTARMYRLKEIIEKIQNEQSD
jgi:hypothetical protein